MNPKLVAPTAPIELERQTLIAVKSACESLSMLLGELLSEGVRLTGGDFDDLAELGADVFTASRVATTLASTCAAPTREPANAAPIIAEAA